MTLGFAARSACVLLWLLVCWNVASSQDGRIRSGRMMYEEHCFRCHGLRGHGDGPEADRLIVKPADFHSARLRAKTDFELWMSAAYGVAYTPMHGWLSRLTEEELLEVLHYVRELAPAQ